MLLNLLLVVEILIGIALTIVVLLQRSEGGALGMGGGPSGFMTARGAGDLLTRTTWILGSSFFVIALVLTVLSGRQAGASSVVDRLNIDAIDPSTLNQPAPQAPAGTAQPTAPAPLQAPRPTMHDPFTGQGAAAPAPAPAPAPAN
ncbi:preprotein translocase subunit SecG [Phenylobacterium sp. LjRoot219]|uniref:preprotein translocase subunit SecG n=1 Tax=Phenylobacterium sp. LjRoot219 TaxID=3342283 RepID=UPI003ECEA784